MLSVDLSHAAPFLPPDYKKALLPRLSQAADQLHSGSGPIGWVTLPQDFDRAEYSRIKSAAQKIRNDSGALVVIGTGGSYLGAHGIIDFLRSPNYNLKKKPNIYFAGHTLSSDVLTETVSLLGESDFSVNVVSKSGRTLEPAVAFRFFRRLLEKKYGKAGAAGRIYVTTGPTPSPLKTFADTQRYETFTIPQNVGGRYSALTAAGLLPAAVAGIDTDALLDGAREMMERCAERSYASPAWQYAAARNVLYSSGKKIELLASFESDFRSAAQWWQQLFAESEGKDGRGIFPVPVSYPADLHSLGQYVQQGERHLFETVVRFAPSAAQLSVPSDDAADGMSLLAGKPLDLLCRQAIEATLLAHTVGSVPNIIISCAERSARTLGELIYFFEYACGLSGYLLGVDPFDQPGVEAYKQNMSALLTGSSCG